MSYRNRGIYAAFAGLGLNSGAHAQQQAESPQAPAAQQAQVAEPEAPATRIAEEIRALRSEVERGFREEVTQTGGSYAERDLNAQEDMAFWALVMALAAVGTFFISAYVAIVVKKTLDATAKAANYARDMAVEAKNATAAIAAADAGREANEIGRQQIRANIVMESIKLESADPPKIVVTLRNDGNSAAREFRAVISGTFDPIPTTYTVNPPPSVLDSCSLTTDRVYVLTLDYSRETVDPRGPPPWKKCLLRIGIACTYTDVFDDADKRMWAYHVIIDTPHMPFFAIPFKEGEAT